MTTAATTIIPLT
jgi:hypothetical protein